MPIYEFICGSSRCPSMGATFDVRLPIVDRDVACVRCPRCNSESRRQIFPTKPPACVITVPGDLGPEKERLLP